MNIRNNYHMTIRARDGKEEAIDNLWLPGGATRAYVPPPKKASAFPFHIASLAGSVVSTYLVSHVILLETVHQTREREQLPFAWQQY